jgi:AraC-like DNA-binding protein
MVTKNVYISTASVEPQFRNDYWREICSPLHVVAPVDSDPDKMRGALHAHMLGPIEIWSTVFNAQQYNRDRRTIAQSQATPYLVLVALAGGSKGDFNNTNFSAQQGDIYIVDSAQPYRSRVDAGKRIVMLMPRELLESVAGKRNLHGVVLKAGQPMTTLLTDYLKALCAVSAQLSSEETASALDALNPLLAGSLADKGTAVISETVMNLTLRQRVLQFIDERITDPDLTLEQLMQRFRVSRSHLYRTFEADGGIARLIRDKRLNLAYQLLTAPAPGSRPRPIKEFAYRCGFANSDHFIRIFTAHFGITPRKAQQEKPLLVTARQQDSGFCGLFREGAAAREA